MLVAAARRDRRAPWSPISAWRAAGEDSEQAVTPSSDDDRADSRHAGLHGARAGRRRRADAGDRRLRARARDVRDGDRRSGRSRRPRRWPRRCGACPSRRARRASWRPNLDPAWERRSCAASQRLPRDRFRAPATSSRRSSGAPAPRPGVTPRSRAGGCSLARGGAGRRSPSSLWRGLSARAAAVAGRHGPDAGPRTGRPRRSIAVLGFRNVSGRPDAAWLSTAFSEMLTTELAAGEQLRTIPGENVRA